VIVSTDAIEDIATTDTWWRINRPDAPDLVRTEVATAIESLEDLAPALPVFRRLRGATVRRVHLPRVHRHIYVATDPDRIVVLAVWGAVRAILPALRARIARVDEED
jgi:hypothetical protein